MKNLKQRLSLSELRAVNTESIKGMNSKEKRLACKLLIQDILMWGSYTPYEAIGFLEAGKLPFILKIEEGKEEEKTHEKREARVITRRYY